ncbi:MAG: hypothetical protein KF873_11690 [Gemmataceae bacterium]|nr:hypothetical protein [Gemmataceae bacterium]
MKYAIVLFVASVGVFLAPVRAQEPAPVAFASEPAPTPAATATQVLLDPAPVDSPKKYPTVELGGVLQLDTGWFSQDTRNRRQVGNARDGTSFRTARLWGKGQLQENVGYMIEMDFGTLASGSPGRPNFQNAYVELQQLPTLGTLRLGRWKQPVSLETVSSIRFLPFIERASLFAFVPFRRTGLGFFDATPDERWTYAASVFRAGDDGYGDLATDAGGWATAARVTHLLWNENDGERLLHLGVSHSYNDAVNDTVRFARFGEFAINQTPVYNLSTSTPNQFDTGIIPTNNYNVLGAEFAWVNGPFSVQAETVVTVVDRIDGTNPVFYGWYLFGSWFATGEHRNYIPGMGAFDRVKPHRNFVTSRHHGIEGPGAWEFLARVSQVDVNDGNVDGGQLTALTLGVNWHWNPNAKLQFNFIQNVRRVPGLDRSEFQVYGFRMAYDF